MRTSFRAQQTEIRAQGIPHPPGNLYEYQTKGVAREAVYMSNKTWELREGEWEWGGVFEMTFIHAENSKFGLLCQ